MQIVDHTDQDFMVTINKFNAGIKFFSPWEEQLGFGFVGLAQVESVDSVKDYIPLSQEFAQLFVGFMSAFPAFFIDDIQGRYRIGMDLVVGCNKIFVEV
jgi:hypothetical protein